ncbi:hypothetical protein AUR64_00805 [Haloprofundus marisrubri]|uniref:GP-PDE domain-containing protein n=1 Tax=Haloprofundus marisrubri TaxID=1514971 RepID=A0A0W1R434_9EURY|nr:glycerophosphodiester phosphodiesterase [Haloprofundus marisrubri]KTG08148.1 hypothetical protein AUR64_00805 [Haloprofundus marisrubri]
MAQLAGHEQTTETETDVSLIAHRGFAGVYPENTRAAFGRAVGTDGATTPQADVVELDVMPTATGEVVVFHDTDLGRLTNAPEKLADRKVWETPYETLRGLDVLGTGESVPLLAEILEMIPVDVELNVEFKNPGVDDVRYGPLDDHDELVERRAVWRPFVERTLSELDRHPHEVLVSSFHEGALAAARQFDATVPIANVFWDDIEAGLRTARRHDCEVLHVPWNMVYGTELFNEEYHAGPFDPIDILDVAHEEGRRVNAWTVESWYQANQLRRAGIDGIIADYPNLLQYGSNRDVAADTNSSESSNPPESSKPSKPSLQSPDVPPQ